MRMLIVATALVVIASLAGWWVWLYNPAREQQLALEEETTALVARESQLANQRQQLLSLQERAPLIRRSLDRLNQFIPPDPEQASFLELLQLAGNASGIRFTSLNFTDPLPVLDAPPTADPELVLGSITVTGTIDSTYFQLVDFLRRLEIEVPRAVLVERVSVAEGPDGYPQVTTAFTAQMFALIAAPVVETPPGTQPLDPADPAATATPVPGATATPVPGATTPPTGNPSAPAVDPAQSGDLPPGGIPATGEGLQTSALPRDAMQIQASPHTTTGQPA